MSEPFRVPPDMARLINAMVRAEGGEQAFIRAVQKSLPGIKTFSDAWDVARNTVLHALWDYTQPTMHEFVEFLGNRWAPIGVDNDPTGLNRNWISNVSEILGLSDGPETRKGRSV